jgi:hypothetical protein
LAAFLVLSFVAATGQANDLKLRRLSTDENGDFIVLFSVLTEEKDPISDPSQIPTSDIKLEAGENPAELQTLDLDDPTLTTLRDYQLPFRIVILLPDVDLFNGVADDPNRPDAEGVRNALEQAVSTLPERSDITIDVGLYNQDIRWLPSYNTTQRAELGSELRRSSSVSPPGTRLEDPFNAIKRTVRNRLRRQARDRSANDYIYYLIVVTSSLTQVDTEEFGRQAAEVKSLLTDRNMEDVTTQIIVYLPRTDSDYLLNADNSPLRFASGVTPESGTYRIVGNVTDFRNAFQQTIDEIASTMVLRFNNTQLPTDANYTFKMTLTPEGGSELVSNPIIARVDPRATNYLFWILLIGGIVIGTLVLVILIVYFIKRPKKEPEMEEAPVYVEQYQLCVQCGRALRDDLNYCHHCAAEPNFGLLKVLEGPDAGWTFFLRDKITDIGKAQGNSVLLKDPGVSGSHLRISVQEGSRYLVQDLESTNGTYIENVAVNQQYLKNGDVIQLGKSTKMKFTIS